MYSWSKQRLTKYTILKTKTVRGVTLYRSIGVLFWNPPTNHFHHYNYQIFSLENQVKKELSLNEMNSYRPLLKPNWTRPSFPTNRIWEDILTTSGVWSSLVALGSQSNLIEILRVDCSDLFQGLLQIVNKYPPNNQIRPYK